MKKEKKVLSYKTVETIMNLLSVLAVFFGLVFSILFMKSSNIVSLKTVVFGFIVVCFSVFVFKFRDLYYWSKDNEDWPAKLFAVFLIIIAVLFIGFIFIMGAYKVAMFLVKFGW